MLQAVRPSVTVIASRADLCTPHGAVQPVAGQEGITLPILIGVRVGTIAERGPVLCALIVSCDAWQWRQPCRNNVAVPHVLLELHLHLVPSIVTHC